MTQIYIFNMQVLVPCYHHGSVELSMNVKTVTVQNYFNQANVDYVSPSDIQAFFVLTIAKQMVY